MIKNYELTKTDFDELANLFTLTQAIDSLYTKLYEMEINNQKDSANYKKHLDYLNISLDIEKNAYNKMRLSPNKHLSLLKYIFEEKIPSDFGPNIDVLIKQAPFDRIIRRIIGKMSYKIMGDYNCFEKISPDLTAFLAEIGINKKTVETSLINNNEINDSFKRDVLNYFMTFNQETIDSNKNNILRNGLIKAKYDLSFVEVEIEEISIQNNFNVDKKLIANSKLTADLLNLNSDLYSLMKDYYGINIVHKQIDDLLDMYDADYIENSNAIKSILKQSYLRAGFLLLSDNEISDINGYYHEVIDSTEFDKTHGEDKIGSSVVLEAFMKIKKDKANHKVITLGTSK